MAVIYNPLLNVPSDFNQMVCCDDLSPSSRDIEEVLGIKLEPELAKFVDSISGKEAFELLCQMLN